MSGYHQINVHRFGYYTKALEIRRGINFSSDLVGAVQFWLNLGLRPSARLLLAAVGSIRPDIIIKECDAGLNCQLNLTFPSIIVQPDNTIGFTVESNGFRQPPASRKPFAIP